MSNNLSSLKKFVFENPKRIEYRLDNLSDDRVIRHDNGQEPAIQSAFGYKAYYQFGLRHRDRLPAIEFEKFKCWYQHGKLHRIGAPAVEYSDGTVEYWLNGVRQK